MVMGKHGYMTIIVGVYLKLRLYVLHVLCSMCICLHEYNSAYEL